MGLIHYGGRIYDARLGRFVQADPIVQDGEDLQAYNRYAYVRNNPLTLTDPSGFSWLGKAARHIRHAVSKAWHAVEPYVSTIVSVALIATGCVYCVYYAAAFNGAWTVANGGSLMDGLVAGASTWAFASMPAGWGAGTRMLASGGIGGLSSVLEGGKFGNGFISAGLSAGVGSIPGLEGASKAWQYGIRAAAGGTISELTGGKFRNGAVSAAASYAAGQAGDALADGIGVPTDVSNDVLKNPGIAGKVTVLDDGTKVFNLQMSYDKSIDPEFAQNYADSISSGWTVRLNEGGTVYSLRVNITIVGASDNFLRGDNIHLFQHGSSQSSDAGDRGGRGISIGNMRRVDTPVHEMGHIFGLNHQENSSNSTMSYSSDRWLHPEDIKRVYNAY